MSRPIDNPLNPRQFFKSPGFCGFFLCLVTVAAFSPVLRAPFLQWDDDTHIYENAHVESFEIKGIFSSTVHKTYIPLTTLTFAVEHRLFGFDPFVVHLNNLLLHLAVVWLVWRLAGRLGLSRWAAFWAALLFALHPMHVESVAWATERKDVLYAVFYLLALDRYLSYLQSQTTGHYLAALGCGLLSMLAKPMALSLPLILFLVDYWERRPLTARTVLEKIPFVIYVVGLGWITYHLNARMPQSSLSEGAALWIWSLSFYLQKFLWPTQLLALYQPPQPVGWAQPPYVAGVCLVLLWGLLGYLGRHLRLWVFAGLFFLASIFFLLRYDYTIIDLSFVADRYMYLPSFGFCLAAGYGLERLRTYGRVRSPAAFVAAMVMIVLLFSCLALKTWRQAQLWTDEIRLWRAVVDIYPISSAYDNLGILYNNRGDYRRAIAYYTRALELYPQDTVRTLNNRGVAYLRSGQMALALEDLTLSIQKGPDYEWAYLNRALIFIRQGHSPQAIADIRQALRINPHNAPARRLLDDWQRR